MAKRHSA